MEPVDDEIRDYVRFKASRLMSVAVYQKLKAAVISHQREEYAKSKVLTGALWGLLALFVFSIVVTILLRPYAGYMFLGAFFIWVAYVLVLMRRHLDTPDEEERES